MIAMKIVKLHSIQVVAFKYFDDVLKGVQVDDDNYYIWQHKIQCLLNTDNTLSAITKRRESPTNSAVTKEKQQNHVQAKINYSVQYVIKRRMQNDLGKIRTPLPL